MSERSIANEYLFFMKVLIFSVPEVPGSIIFFALGLKKGSELSFYDSCALSIIGPILNAVNSLLIPGMFSGSAEISI